MKTKLILFFLVNTSLLVLLNLFCSAQKLSIEIKGGYNLKPFQSIVGVEGTYLPYDYRPGGVYRDRNVSGSFGQGISCAAGLVFGISKHSSIVLDGRFLQGKEFLFRDSVATDYKKNYKSVKMVQVIPGIRMSSDTQKRFQVFAQVGLVIGVNATLTEKISGSQQQLIFNYDRLPYEEEIRNYGGMSLGYSGTAGLAYKLSNKLSALLMLEGIHQIHTFTKGKVTKFNVSGTDKLSSLYKSQSEFIYADNPYAHQSDINNPSYLLKEYHPFSSIGLILGVKYYF